VSVPELIRAVLVAEGADNEGGWHSWRCFDKERYPEPCTCTADVVAEIMTVVEVAIQTAEKSWRVRLNVDDWPAERAHAYERGVLDERKRWMDHKKRIPYTEDYIVHVEDMEEKADG